VDRRLTDGDFFDSGALVTKLQAGLGPGNPDPVSNYIASQIVPGNPAAAAALFAQTAFPDIVDGGVAKATIIDRLNAVLRGPSLLSQTSFANVQVLQSTIDLSVPAPTGERLIRLNRLLMEDAYRKEIARSLDTSFVVRADQAGLQWTLIRVDKVEPNKQNEKFTYSTQYHLTFDPATNTLTIQQPWRGIEYRVGRGNFPLWESTTLRD